MWQLYSEGRQKYVLKQVIEKKAHIKLPQGKPTDSGSD